MGDGKKQRVEQWKAEPDEHDFASATAYLSLLFSDAATAELVERIRAGATVFHQAKDLIRASRLPLLGVDDPIVARDLKKVARGEAISPVLLLRGDLARGIDLVVADGYHRICASYHVDESAPIPCWVGELL